MDVWCEVDSTALAKNIQIFRQLIGTGVRLAPAVKGNGYGHGLLVAARAFLAGGADWLCVHSLSDLRALRTADIRVPIQLLGPIRLDDLAQAVALDARILAYNSETIDRLISLGVEARIHLKIETGIHRQGVDAETAVYLADRIASADGLILEGVSSHFANIEDTTDHRYAHQQVARFKAAISTLRARGHKIPIRHLSNSAAALLWPDQVFDMVRVGIAGYGLWPSKETQVVVSQLGRKLVLHPAMTWKTFLAQIKTIPADSPIGYGCTYVTTRETRLGILPVGYYDGYGRGLSNLGHVLVRGQRAPIRGRVCMNITMIDLTDIPDALLEDEVVLLGTQGEATISAEQLASWQSTINYEVVTRIAEHVPRFSTEPIERPQK